MVLPTLASLAIPGVSALIFFLAYPSQYLFLHLEPSPLTRQQFLVFNFLVLCIWICYARACMTDPGRIAPNASPELTKDEKESSIEGPTKIKRQRWCRKCDAVKPLRAHHCKVCKRCIPKMDHHCPWTTNCVSHLTFPHFIRFVFYAVAAMSYLEYFLFVRALVIWDTRNLPSYLGPSVGQLVFLFLFLVVNSITLFALSILLIRSMWSLGANETTIEGWEIERHRAVLRRAKVLGGFLDGPDGLKVKITQQQFPYDIGIWKNIQQGMGGSSNILSWVWPFSATPSMDSGLDFEVNGFEDESSIWPPPDPDRMPRTLRSFDPRNAFIHSERPLSDQDEMQAFRTRQQEDLKRREHEKSRVRRQQTFQKRYASGQDHKDNTREESEDSGEGEEAWANSEGDRLRDFGVDEETEFYDEDDVPVAELLRMRKEHPALPNSGSSRAKRD